ncbi:EthD family reductase [Pseudomonas sp. LTJR-52]|uniref:EthD family reductase n=1 Tax=Pseudomonas sp. LTJR-52 TaxID=2479392 RepID=UPI000EFABF65|nr:EthD family reductase [Pseudomonas sp. LTJR-52]AYN96977.1 EthD family reductase [Pseudomonas sp. LTJR-52]
MHKLSIFYHRPSDPAHFEDYYINQHIPLVPQLPDLIRFEYSFPQLINGEPAPWFCLFEAYFPDLATLQASVQSVQGQQLATDVSNYAQEIPLILVSEVATLGK